MSYFNCIQFGGLAQKVERAAVNRCVIGSSPITPAISYWSGSVVEQRSPKNR